MTTKVFYNTADLMSILGCSSTKARQIKKTVNDEAIKRGLLIASAKLCSARLFEELYITKNGSPK